MQGKAFDRQQCRTHPSFFIQFLLFIIFTFLLSSPLTHASASSYTAVHSVGGLGRDFTSLQAWEDARQGNLLTRHVFSTSNQNAPFIAGETVVGQSSGAQGGYVKERDIPSASESFMSLDTVSGVFQAGEVLTGLSSGATALLDTVLSTQGTIEKAEVFPDRVFSSGVIIEGSTTDADHYLDLSVPEPWQHKGRPGTGVVIDPDGFFHAFDVRDDFTRIAGFEITGWPNQSGNSSWEGVHVHADNVLLEFLLIHDDDFGTYNNPNSDAINLNHMIAGQSVTIRNSIIYNISRGGINYQGTGTITATIENVTIFNTGLVGADGDGGINNNSASATFNIINTISMDSNSGADFKHPGILGLSSNNLSSDASAPGLSPLTGRLPQDQFVSITPGSEDFHLKPGAGAIGAGVDQSLRFTKDIDLITRTLPWDIGADHSGSAGAIITITTNTLPDGELGAPYLQTLTQTGGVEPISWLIISGALPQGIFLSLDGTLSGTPVLEQSTTFTIEAQDTAGNTATKEYSLTIQGTAPPSDTEPPSVPGNLSAAALSDSQISLSWLAATDNVSVTGYEVFRNSTLVASTTTPAFSDTGLSDNTLYTYTVRAFDNAGNLSGNSSPATATTDPLPDTEPPSVPGNLSAAALSDSQISLSWLAATDNVSVTGYEVFRNSTLVASTTTPAFSDTGLSDNTLYTYTVRAFDNAGNLSGNSSPATATTDPLPGPPAGGLLISNIIANSGLAYEAVSYGLLTDALIYIDRNYVYTDIPAFISGATYIKTANNDKASTGSDFLSFDVNKTVAVYVAHDDRLSFKPAWMNTFSDSGEDMVIANKPHSLYKKEVPAGTVILGGNEGPKASMYTVIILEQATAPPSDTEPPSVPGNLSAAALSDSQISLSWLPATDNVSVTGYEVFRNSTLVASTTTPAFSDTGLSDNTLYTYTVRAFDNAGNLSENSSPATATTDPLPDTEPPSVPGNLSAAALSDSQISLSWLPATDNVSVTGYEVFRNSTLVASTTTPAFSDTGLSDNTLYTYTVRAFDSAGNLSGNSSPATATTDPLPGPPPPGWPYPASSIISEIIWDTSSLYRTASGSDNWAVTWGPDDHVYTTWGDGGGFGGADAGLGVARIEGTPSNFTGFNLWGEPRGYLGGKSLGIVSIDGILYMWVGPHAGSTAASENWLQWSTDLGNSWQRSEIFFTYTDGFSKPSILNFGRDYAGARDNYVYSYGFDRSAGINTRSTELHLARVLKSEITNRTAYEFFKGLDINGNPLWTSDVGQRSAVFTNLAGGISDTPSVVYNPGLDRYIMCKTFDTNSSTPHGGLGIFEAPEPWGPWRTIEYTESWMGSDNMYYCNFQQKWTSSDGLDMWMVFTGYGSDVIAKDAYQHMKGTLVLTNPLPLAINTQNLPNGTQDIPYSETLLVSGGTAPYSWSLIAGNLPVGLSLSTNGVLSGTPSLNESAAFSISVQDSTGDTSTRAYTMTINLSSAGYTAVHSVGGLGRDFTSLQAWEDARQGNLLTRHVFSTSNQNAPFIAGETVVGQSSGAQGGYVKERDIPSASESFMSLDTVSGVFQAGEVLTGLSSGATALLDTVLSTQGTIEKAEVFPDRVFSSGVIIEGSTTDADHYLDLSVPEPWQHKGRPGTGVVIDPDGFFHAFDVRDDFTRIAGFEITGWPNQSGNSSWEGVHVHADNVLLEFLLIHDDDFGTYNNPNSDAINLNHMIAGQSVTIRNSIIYNISRGGINYQGTGTITATIENVTIFNTGLVGADGDGGINNNSASATFNIINTISMDSNSGADFKHPGILGLSSNNLSSDASAPGLSPLTGRLPQDQFVSITPGSEDFHLKPGAGAIGAGVDQSLRFTKDIDLITRTLPWDIGADHSGN